MGDTTKRVYDMLTITKDITEREKIVQQFQRTGFIDRNDAINKIVKLQATDVKLAVATMTMQIERESVDLHQVDNSTIVMNMQFQIDFLKEELAKLALEEKKDG